MNSLPRPLSANGPRRGAIWPALVTFALALAGAACGPDGGGLSLHLTVAHQSLDARGPAAEPGSPPPNIDAFRLCVRHPGGEAIACRRFGDLTQTRFRIDDLPTGAQRVVTFEGYRTSDELVLWCGRAVGIDIRDSAVTPVRMMLSRCGGFTDTVSPPNLARAGHSASLLPDGRVLLLGGFDRHEESSLCDLPCRALLATGAAELYDPATGAFSSLASGLNHPRGLHTALALADGRVLVAGGCEVASLQSEFDDPERPGSPLRCALPGLAATTLELFDPRNDTSQVLELPGALFAALVPVTGDEALLLGGLDDTGAPDRRVTSLRVSGSLVTVESFVDGLVEPRAQALALAYSGPDDPTLQAMVIGGASAPLPDEPGPFAERIVFQGGGLLTEVPRFVDEVFGEGLPVADAAGARLGPGRVLVCGGWYPGRFLSQDMPFLPKPLSEAAVFDLRFENLQLLDASNRLSLPRALHTVTALDEAGQALVVGGFTRRMPEAPLRHQATASAELWDDGNTSFSLLWLEGEPVSLSSARALHSATRLADGSVLICGGLDEAGLVGTAELFNPMSSSLLEE